MQTVVMPAGAGVEPAPHFLIVDDDFGCRAGIAQTLAAHYSSATLHQAGSVAEAMATLSAAASIDVVLLDLTLPDGRGVETLQRLKGWCEVHGRRPRLIVLSAAADYDESIIADAIEHCATGFIAKGTSEAVFRAAIELTLAGGIYIPERYFGRRPHSEGEVALTKREQQVVAHLTLGLTYKEIARALAKPRQPMSDATVRVHVQRVAWKLQVAGADRRLHAKAAVLTALAQGRIRLPATAP